jgi:hypothetical protein
MPCRKTRSTLWLDLVLPPRANCVTGEKLYIRMMAVAAAFLFGHEFVKLQFKRTPLPEFTVH